MSPSGYAASPASGPHHPRALQPDLMVGHRNGFHADLHAVAGERARLLRRPAASAADKGIEHFAASDRNDS
jgi:hypothetical protein